MPTANQVWQTSADLRLESGAEVSEHRSRTAPALDTRTDLSRPRLDDVRRYVESGFLCTSRASTRTPFKLMAFWTRVL